MRIILGAGTTERDGWVSTQEHELNLLNPADFQRVVGDEGADSFLSEHAWEHMSMEEGRQAAANCYAALKPGGYMRVAVPDANFRNQAYQQAEGGQTAGLQRSVPLVQIGGPGDPDHPAASHKVVYSYRTLVEVFAAAGFRVELLEYCDDRGDFHYAYWNPDDGHIGRSYRFDTRNNGELIGMVSVIIDAKKELVVGTNG